MRILFSMRHSGALRNFASTLQALAARNHRVHLVFTQQDREGDGRLLWELTHASPNITCADLENKMPWRIWRGLGRVGRCTVDYVRYLTPEYDRITSLKERARAKVIRPVRWFVELPIFRSRTGNRLLIRALLIVERAIPVDRAMFDLVAGTRPDLLLVTPLVDIGTDQVDYVKAAQRLGIRCALPVLSWDNLTNKGLIRIQPDKIFVWNEAQKTEAVTMHGANPDDVVVTGAMVYDQWFTRRPSTSREEFCARVGLDPERPILLYLCSSPFIAPDEVNFIERWIAAIRGAADARLRTAGILVRPHPENLQPWRRFDEKALENVVVWPKGGASPVDFDSRNDFFDSMYHSAGAIGINTSAQIECGIVGRPVFSIRTPEYQRTQDGTLHFRHLTSEGGGLLQLADDFETHVRQLANALDDPEGTARRVAGFVRAFTRPHGLDQEATPRIVEAIEQLAAAPAPAPQRLPLYVYPLRVLLYPMALVLKATRRLARVSNKRQRQLRPVTVSSTLMQVTLTVFDWLFRFRPVKDYFRHHIIPRALPRLAAMDVPTEEAVAVPRLVQKLSRREQRIIVGPWVSEVGFELLYWIPFLNWVEIRAAVRPRAPGDRLTWRLPRVVPRHHPALPRPVRLLHARAVPAEGRTAYYRGDPEAAAGHDLRSRRDQAGEADASTCARAISCTRRHMYRLFHDPLAGPRFGEHGRELHGAQTVAADRHHRSGWTAAGRLRGGPLLFQRRFPGYAAQPPFRRGPGACARRGDRRRAADAFGAAR